MNRNPGSLADAAFRDRIRAAKLRLLKMHFDSRAGHIGGNLSCFEILMTLHHRVLRADDLFILSKGHAAGALYVTLWSTGKLSDADLCHFYKDGTLLAGHPPPHGIPAIPFATGSLGHGLSLAAGAALGRKLRGNKGRVFCLTSDGEWNEGTCWEAILFSVQHGLDLTVIVDRNGWQGFGTTCQVMNTEPLVDKLRAFRADVTVVDGHDPIQIESGAATGAAGLRILVADTVKGHGISFMENRLESHYLPLNEAQYRQAIEEVGAR